MKKVLQTILFKTLSRNDTGETRSHQSGISIPKDVAQSDLFPPLRRDILNHRQSIVFFDENEGRWEFKYIYYNDKYHGKDPSICHDEYRLTCVTKFMRENHAKAGDQVWFGKDTMGKLYIGISKDVPTKILDVTAEISSHTSKSLEIEDENDDMVSEGNPILDPRKGAQPIVIKLAKDWTKVEFNK